MMKEYTFGPASLMVSVAEGASVQVSVHAVLVAFSSFNATLSLSGDHEAEVLVEAEIFMEAVGLAGAEAECGQYQEKALSDAQGSFRIRGLHPKCSYCLGLKAAAPGVNEQV